MVSFPEVVIRDSTNLDDYLYEPNSKYQSAEAKKVRYQYIEISSLKMFDYVDMVFIDGDGNLLPWLRRFEKVKKIIIFDDFDSCVCSLKCAR